MSQTNIEEGGSDEEPLAKKTRDESFELTRKNVQPINSKTKKPQKSVSSKYNYLNLEEVLAKFPVQSSMFVSIHAVICAYDHVKGTLSVFDETLRNFQIFINPCLDPKDPEAPRLPIRPGDIIRIHRLTLFTDYTRRCPNVKNIVIFESFRDKPFKPVYLSKNPTIEDFDRERVQSLSDWHNRKLLEGITRVTNTMYTIGDVALQVLCKFEVEKRTLLACWNGKHWPEYPCSPLFQFDRIQTALAKCRARHIYTDEYIKRLYEEKKLFFISVYGVHQAVTMTIQPLDVIIAYNLLIKSDKFYYGCYSYILHEGTMYGRALRVADYNSELANNLRAQIEGHYFLNGTLSYENYNFDQSPSQIMSPSKIFESDSSDDESQLATARAIHAMRSQVDPKQNQTPKPSPLVSSPSPLEETQNTFMSSLDETSLGQMECLNELACTHLNFTPEEKTILYRLFGGPPKKPSVPDAVMKQSFSQIKTQSESLFRIQARFHSLVFEKSYLSTLFESISNLRRLATVVQCISDSNEPKCSYRASFSDFLSDKRVKYHIVEGNVVATEACTIAQPSTSSGTQVERLMCPECSSISCIVSLDFMVILQDYSDSLLFTQLTGPEANILFSCSTADFCSSNSAICTKISAIFKYLFHITNHPTPCIRKVDWTLESIGSANDPNQTLFKIVDFAILSQEASCGVANTDQSFPLISSSL